MNKRCGTMNEKEHIFFTVVFSIAGAVVLLLGLLTELVSFNSAFISTLLLWSIAAILSAGIGKGRGAQRDISIKVGEIRQVVDRPEQTDGSSKQDTALGGLSKKKRSTKKPTAKKAPKKKTAAKKVAKKKAAAKKVPGKDNKTAKAKAKTGRKKTAKTSKGKRSTKR